MACACLYCDVVLDVLTFGIAMGPLEQHGLPHLSQHVAAVIAGAAIHPHSHIHSRVQHFPHRCNACIAKLNSMSMDTMLSGMRGSCCAAKCCWGNAAFCQHVAAVIAGAAIHSHSHIHSHVQHFLHQCNACPFETF